MARLLPVVILLLPSISISKLCKYRKSLSFILMNRFATFASRVIAFKGSVTGIRIWN